MAFMVQDPAVQGRASLDPFSTFGSGDISIASPRRVQMLAAKHRLSPALARQVVWLCYGECWHD